MLKRLMQTHVTTSIGDGALLTSPRGDKLVSVNTLLMLLLLAVTSLSAPAPVEARPAGRSLMQAGVNCTAQIPACHPRRCMTRIMDSRETFVCLRCLRSFVPARRSLRGNGILIAQCGE
jgi:hypothetical protein